MPTLSSIHRNIPDTAPSSSSALASLSPPILIPETLFSFSSVELAHRLGPDVTQGDIKEFKSATARTLREMFEGVITSSDGNSLEPRCIPSGFADIDTALGGGYKVGRIYEVTGPSSSGKTQLCLAAISAAAVTSASET